MTDIISSVNYAHIVQDELDILEEKLKTKNIKYNIIYADGLFEASFIKKQHVILVGDNIQQPMPSQKFDVDGDLYLIGRGIEARFGQISGNVIIINALDDITKNNPQIDLNTVNNLDIENIKGSLMVRNYQNFSYNIAVISGVYHSIEKSLVFSPMQDGSQSFKNIANLHFLTYHNINISSMDNEGVIITQGSLVLSQSHNEGIIYAEKHILADQVSNRGRIESKAYLQFKDSDNHRRGSLVASKEYDGGYLVGDIEIRRSRNFGDIRARGKVDFSHNEEGNYGSIWSKSHITLSHTVNRGIIVSENSVSLDNVINFGDVKAKRANFQKMEHYGYAYADDMKFISGNTAKNSLIEYRNTFLYGKVRSEGRILQKR